MSQSNNGGPAFPQTQTIDGNDKPLVSGLDVGEGGMSLRDYFAAKALTGMLADPQVHVGGERSAQLAGSCYELADAMLKAREQ